MKFSANNLSLAIIDEVSTFFGVGQLSQLHLERKFVEDYTDVWVTEASRNIHRQFYEALNLEQGGWYSLINLYRQLISEVVIPVVGEDIVFQKFPTFRFQPPGFKAINKPHFDSDSDHGHPLGEINFILALTDMYGTNAVWSESVPTAHDFSPLEASAGEIVMFNGNQCLHFNRDNVEVDSRVSLDFRVIRKSVLAKYSNRCKSSASNAKAFCVGGYYDEF